MKGRCCKLVSVLGEDPGDIFDQPSCKGNFIWSKLADHVGEYVALSPGGAGLVISPGKESSNLAPPDRFRI